MIASNFLRPHYQEIILFSTPILLSMVMQNLMGVVDSALVGQIGTEALAAYGLAFFIHFIHVAPLMGLATAVQALTANAMGHGKTSEAANPLNSAIFTSIVTGVAISLIANLYIDVLLTFMTKDPKVIALASNYLKMRFLGIFAIGMTHSFRGYWNGIGRPKTFLFIMSFSYVVNALISYALIFGKWGFPQLGMGGVALGSVLATILAALINFIWAWIHTRQYGFNQNYLDQNVWRRLLAQSIPSGLQQFLFALGYAVFFAIIGKLGANELAAANVLVTISLFLIYPGMAMGMTAATYVAKSLGARDVEKSYFWTRKIAIFSSWLFALISIPLMIFSDEILSIFIHSPEVLQIAKVPLMIFLSTLVFEILGQVYTFAFFGAGKPKVILTVTIMIQWLGILPVSYFLGTNLTSIWIIQIGFRCLQAFILFVYWSKSKKQLSP